MILNERKIKILEAIINDYIKSAEPIGSRTIAKKYDLGISSATIRNEMSDLEELGLIIQPHTSSGRIPSDKGYRLFVDQLMRKRELNESESSFIRRMVAENISRMDYLMQETAKAIAFLTNYTTIVTEPQNQETRIKHLQLIPYDENSIIFVVITDNKSVKNYTIDLNHKIVAPGKRELELLTAFMNNKLVNMSLSDINDSVCIELIENLPQFKHVLVPVLDQLIKAVLEEQHVQYYTSGVKNILSFPEFSDLGKAKAIFQALEEKDMLITLLDNDKSDNISILIGSENSLEQMRDCSVIRANYRFGGNNYGGIGIIGPTRMDYAQVVSLLTEIINNINVVLDDFTGG